VTMIVTFAYPVTMITTDMPRMCGHLVSKDAGASRARPPSTG
jgi:hypothetical protein